MKVCGLVLSLTLLLSSATDFIKGVVVISPSPVAAVCQEGDQLELTCTSSDIFLRWEFTIFPENMTHATTPVTSAGTSGVPPPLMISGSMITFSRLSGPNVLPLVFRVTVDSVSSGLNGTVVKCFEGSTSTDAVATTTIRIIDPFAQFELSARLNSEEFLSDGVTVNLEWTFLNSQSYYQQFLHNISISANPQPNNVMFTGNMRVQLTLSYNILYNVSITQHSTCQQLVGTTFIELSYSKCSDPMKLTNALDFIDPALEGQNITFACPPGQILNESNSSTCMGNGEWEPDPREVECTGGMRTTGAITSGPIIVQHTEKSNSESDNVPALISVSCVAVVASVLMFIIGFVCGHCFNQRRKKLTQHEQTMSTSTAAASNEPEVDLELKDNVAYVTLRG